MDIYIGQSKLSVQMKYLGFLWRVLRRLVWETATDTTTGLAAQMAYLFLFALAPGSLFLWHLLGLFGTDPTKLHRMFLLLKSFMPPDPKVQDILDSAMANVVVTGSSGLLANAGIILGIYFGTVFIADDFTRPQPYVRNTGRSPLVVEVYHLFFPAVLVRDHHRVLLQRNRLW